MTGAWVANPTLERAFTGTLDVKAAYPSCESVTTMHTALISSIRRLTLLSVLLAGVGLSGCTTLKSAMIHPAGGDRLEYAVVGGLNAYGIGRIDETCGPQGKNLNGWVVNRHVYSVPMTPYRVVDLMNTSMGSNFLTAEDPIPFKAFVPDAFPKLIAGDVVLIRPGDDKSLSQTVGAVPDGRSNVVVKFLVPASAWKGIGSAISHRPTVGHNIAPWPVEPWDETVAHYHLTFTPFYSINPNTHKCTPLRDFPTSMPADMTGYPKWPAPKPLG